MSNILTLYGIPNCDTVKQARTWLTGRDVDFIFHDFKKHGLASDTVTDWLETLPWDVLVNRKGTTWRNLAEARKAAIVDAASAQALMLELPSVIKRPVLDLGYGAKADAYGRFQVGFSDAIYSNLFDR